MKMPDGDAAIVRSKVLGAEGSSGVRGSCGAATLLSGVPAHGLLRGQVGTVVELLDGAYEIEFSDDEGKTYAELALAPDQLLVLHYRPQRAA